jgi:hypothetical protein
MPIFNRFQRLFQEATDATDAGSTGGDQQQQQQSQQQAPAYFNADGSLGENWHTGLGDEFAPHAPTLGRFKNVGDLARSYMHLRTNGPAYPGENSTAEDISRFRQLAQVPETKDGYSYKPENLPEGLEWSEEKASGFFELAHKHHMPAPAVKAIVDYQLEREAARMQESEAAAAAALKANEDALVTEWRGDFEANKSTVRHLTETLARSAGVPTDDPAIAQLANTPAFAKMMMQVAKLTAEDTIRTPAGLGDLRSPQQRADAIIAGTDPEWGKKYTEGTTEERVAAYEFVKQLINQAKK